MMLNCYTTHLPYKMATATAVNTTAHCHPMCIQNTAHENGKLRIAETLGDLPAEMLARET